jgi:hypothetical protein
MKIYALHPIEFGALKTILTWIIYLFLINEIKKIHIHFLPQP